MKISVEMSLYPLREGFVPVIEEFIERLRAHEDLTVMSTTMSTRVFGEYDRVFEVLHAEMRRVHDTVPHTVLVAKFIGGDLTPEDGGRYA
jgi:uncharacterized protein YqgV (UPF0045/DUF77 family)